MWMGRSNANSYGKKSFIHHTHANGCSTNHAQNSPYFTNNGSTWQHIIVTTDPNGQRRIYRNGVLVRSNSACGEIIEPVPLSQSTSDGIWMGGEQLLPGYMRPGGVQLRDSREQGGVPVQLGDSQASRTRAL